MSIWDMDRIVCEVDRDFDVPGTFYFSLREAIAHAQEALLADEPKPVIYATNLLKSGKIDGISEDDLPKACFAKWHQFEFVESHMGLTVRLKRPLCLMHADGNRRVQMRYDGEPIFVEHVMYINVYEVQHRAPKDLEVA